MNHKQFYGPLDILPVPPHMKGPVEVSAVGLP